jgi:aminoglycoside phosphotransferase (APT) family kinase protein
MASELGPLIGQGRQAEVYAWADGQVVKLFYEGEPREGAEHEAMVTRAVHDAGAPAPDTGEIVEVNGRAGIVFERIHGPAMLQSVMRRPWRFLRMARDMAELHAEVHSHTAPELRSVREVLDVVLGEEGLLPERFRKAALDALPRLPEGDSILHGDFHPDNILLTAGGPRIIDWTNALRGDPLADVARTWMLLEMAAIPEGTPLRWLITALRRRFFAVYLKRYRQLRPFKDEELDAWKLLILATRVQAEPIPEETEQLLRVMESYLT